MALLKSPKKNVKGKILRVKQGYNPNSSSMGSIVFILPATVLAVTAGFGAVSSIIMSVFLKSTDAATQNDESSVSKSER
jgi:hypothetical protein